MTKLWCFLFGHKRREGRRRSDGEWVWVYFNRCPRCGKKLPEIKEYIKYRKGGE